MKNIEDIEKLSMEALEGIASDESVRIPDSLEDAVKATVMASAIAESVAGERKKSSSIWKNAIYAGSVVAAACLLAMFFVFPQDPKDTFDDPRMAYAELERTFSYISSKMDKGLEIASDAEPVLEKAVSVFKENDNRQ